MKIKLGDIIVVIFILLIACSVLFFSNKDKGSFAIVKQNGSVVKTLDLSKDIEFVCGGDYSNTITVKDGRVAVTHTDCPGKECVQTGYISQAGRSICCLPNRLIITVTSDINEVDVITG